MSRRKIEWLPYFKQLTVRYNYPGNKLLASHLRISSNNQETVRFSAFFYVLLLKKTCINNPFLSECAIPNNIGTSF